MAIDKAVTVRSSEGPANTLIVGARDPNSENGTVGGVSGGTVINSIVVDNECATYPNYGPSVVFTNSLTYPEQADWAEGNITNAPIFFEAGSGYGLDHVPGDYRLQSHLFCSQHNTMKERTTTTATTTVDDWDFSPRNPLSSPFSSTDFDTRHPTPDTPAILRR